MARTIQTPGDGPLAALDDVEDVAADHESRTLTAAARAALDAGDDDGAQAMLDQAIAAKRSRRAAKGAKASAGVAIPESLAGDAGVLAVAGAPMRPDSASPYGPELPYTAGTLLRDGRPCDGSVEPTHYVGRILTDQGWLINRAVPLT